MSTPSLSLGQREQALRIEDFLRREKYIRAAGVLLTLSPIGNFLWSAALSGIHAWYRPQMLWVVARHMPGILWFLWGSAFTAGLLMLKGKRSSWTFTLCILGMNIVFGIITFKRAVQLGWFQPTLSMLINFGLFGLIYTQEFHQRLEVKLRAARMIRPFTIAFASGIQVSFESSTPWAVLNEISNTGLRLRSFDGNAPRQIEFRAIEIALRPDLVVKARFSAKKGHDYFFRFVELKPGSISALHRWAQEKSFKSRAA